MIFLELYLSFFKIGLFGFGGGYAMLSLIQHETVVRNGWISDSGFADMVAISQMTPGPISINIATYLGYSVTDSIMGAVVTTLGVCSPSIIIMLIIALLYSKLKRNRYIKGVMKALAPVVVGLILSAFIALYTPENFSDYKSYIIFAVALFMSLAKVHPVAIISMAGIAGILFY